jgi:ATP-dependent helicase HrpA
MKDARVEEMRRLLPQAMLRDWVRLGSRLVRLLRDHHHSAQHESVLERLLAQARESVALRERRGARVPAISYPEALPIISRRQEIVEAIRQNQVVVIAGETGSGKTTQLPKMCLEAGLGIEGKIGCTQPRRVAALSISRRIAEELGVGWGVEVGCKIRFDDRASEETYIKVMTDGILLAETQGDPLLCEYNALIIDEAHERSLNIDFLLGYLKGLLARRPELKLIITSATIDTQAFSQAFQNAPIIEVSGRVFPVEVVYAPLDEASEERGDLTYVDAALEVVGQVLEESRSGDILIFLPGERDIRETSDQLRGRFSSEAEVIPLFARLSAGDQQRVFALCARRKIIVSTNLAETSLTIPGIRYVIDSGLARLSRYDSRTRTRRLPIEPIAQSSAEQRKGRAGRVQQGVCIRLFSEADFAERPRFTQPEIQRANLAEVILRMKAFQLGEIETFPFLNPPSPAAIQGGYRLLQELGALDEARLLTRLGRDLARLPIDPTLGRMLLQAQEEHATRELLIIAAGLSIQDPRDRPLDQKEAAAAAHRRFADPQSDFLTLLRIWEAVHEQWESLRTQNQRRKFCKANFLSYVRMREWQDLHAQLHDALEDLGNLRINESNAAYAAIHRSVLAGLLGHVALRTERNAYKTGGNRQLVIFPGSALFHRVSKEAKPRQGRRKPEPAETAGQPEWVVAGEIVETSQLFARTVAGIDPLWIVDLGRHLCRVKHANPHWSPEAGRVLAEEQISLYGLEVSRRQVAYGNINPGEATAIFIRSALVEEHLFPDIAEPDADLKQRVHRETPPATLNTRFPFLEHNRRLRQKIEIWQTRTRRHDVADLDEGFVRFYSGRLHEVSSIHELDRFLAEDKTTLLATEADLVGEQDLSYDTAAFPDTVALAGRAVPLSYAYAPGEERDGVTLTLDPGLAAEVSPAEVEWAVPGLREAQVSELLRALPKAIRRQLMPLPPKVTEIARELRPSGQSLKQDLVAFLTRRYGVEVKASSWGETAIPQHVRPRIEILGSGSRSMGTGRDLVQLRSQLDRLEVQPPAEPESWTRLTQKWERFGVTSWNFGDLPERVVQETPGTPPLEAWPGLRVEDGHVNIRLFRTHKLARQSSLSGLHRLLEIELQRDLAWLQKDLRAVVGHEPLYRGWCTSEELQAAAFAHLRDHLLPRDPAPALTHESFLTAAAQARIAVPGLAVALLERLEVIFTLRREILRRGESGAPLAPTALKALWDLKPVTAARREPPKSSWIEGELDALLPKNFLQIVPFDRLAHMPRYLKALRIRVERALVNPVKDQERARQLAPYLEALKKRRAQPHLTIAATRRLDEFRWMLEEFRVSLFAQELGTLFPVSAKRLDRQIEILGTDSEV